MNIWLVARRDFASYLTGITGYVIIAGALFVNGVLFNAWAVGSDPKYSTEVLEDFFFHTSGLVMIAALLLTMRSIAEERSTNTIVLLQTSPIADWQVVAGKYLAAFGMVALLTGLTFYMPAQIFIHGKVSWAHIGTGYLGLLLLGSATTALGIFASSLFKNQVAAAFTGGFLLVTLLTTWMLSRVTDPPFSDVLAYAAFFDKHYSPFTEGRLATSGVVYYVTMTGAFLLLSNRVLEGRRWE